MLAHGSVRQSGQAIVLVMLLLLVGVLATLALLRTGILTSEKMQLQNAADATAYSISVLEARDLNYGAYMNRAMVANDVAIGQMVSLASWYKIKQKEPELLKRLAQQINLYGSIPYIGVIFKAVAKVVEVQAKIYDKLFNQQTVAKIFANFTKIASQSLYTINRIYQFSQKMMHIATFVQTQNAFSNIPQQNYDKAEPSTFGYFALAAHYSSYYLNLISPSANLYQFIKHPSTSKPSNDSERLVQMINDSQGGFSRKRRCDKEAAKGLGITIPLGDIRVSLDYSLGPVGIRGGAGLGRDDYVSLFKVDCTQASNDSAYGHGGWDYKPLDVKLNPYVDLGGSGQVPLFRFGFDIHAGGKLEYESKAERRGGTVLAASKNDGSFLWSASDAEKASTALTLGVNFDVGVELCFEACIPFTNICLFSECVGGSLSDIPGLNNLTNIVIGPISPPIIPSDNVHTSSYAGRPDNLHKAPKTSANAYRDTQYGGVTQIKSSWTPDNRILKKYEPAGGAYQMVSDKALIASKAPNYITGLEAPYMLVALTQSGEKFVDQTAGVFELEEAGRDYRLGSGEVPLAAIAKSEVYYAEPYDSGLSSVFARKNQRRAKANGFNPYWDARLVDTSYNDRALALILQQGQVPVPSELAELKLAVESALDLMGSFL